MGDAPSDAPGRGDAPGDAPGDTPGGEEEDRTARGGGRPRPRTRRQ